MNSSVTFKILTDISQMTGLKPGSHPRVARIGLARQAIYGPP